MFDAPKKLDQEEYFTNAFNAVSQGNINDLYQILHNKATGRGKTVLNGVISRINKSSSNGLNN